MRTLDVVGNKVEYQPKSTLKNLDKLVNISRVSTAKLRRPYTTQKILKKNDVHSRTAAILEHESFRNAKLKESLASRNIPLHSKNYYHNTT